MTTKVVEDEQKGGAVTDEQLGRLSIRQVELHTRIRKGSVDFQSAMDGLQLSIDGKTFELLQISQSGSALSFADRLILKTEKLLSKRFGKKITADPLPPEFTEENLKKWARWDLRPIFLPGENITENRQLKNWARPEVWFYRIISESKIASDSAWLKCGWYLADFSKGVDYADGTQVFSNDPLAPIIERLRREKKVGKYDNTPIGSRFSITPQEWPIVLAELASVLDLKPEQINLERCIEFNAIGNLYDKNRGKFNMWEWFEDSFEDSRRLYGGFRGLGGLANVGCNHVSYRYDGIAARPLVSFFKK